MSLTDVFLHLLLGFLQVLKAFILIILLLLATLAIYKIII